MQGEKAINTAPEPLQPAAVRVYQQGLAQVGQAPVVGELLPPVAGLGGRCSTSTTAGALKIKSVRRSAASQVTNMRG